MKNLGKFVLIATLITGGMLLLASCTVETPEGVRKAPAASNYNVRIYTDTEYGCEYLITQDSTGNTSITPRVGSYCFPKAD